MINYKYSPNESLILSSSSRVISGGSGALVHLEGGAGGIFSISGMSSFISSGSENVGEYL